MTEKQALIAMLVRAGVGHGTRTNWTDGTPSGESVLVECDDSDDTREWTCCEFSFDADGKLTGVAAYEGQVG